MIKRAFDLILAAILIVILGPLLLLIALLVRLTSHGPAMHWSKRVGCYNKIFLMPKFRSMKTSAPQVATHLMTNPNQFLTSIGGFLRKSSLDELPQILSVLKGDMSFVGPRPALFNQIDLMELRTQKGVHVLKPGITGWAQVNGRDELSIPVKVEFDFEYMQKESLVFDFRILVLTALKVFSAKGVSH